MVKVAFFIGMSKCIGKESCFIISDYPLVSTYLSQLQMIENNYLLFWIICLHYIGP